MILQQEKFCMHQLPACSYTGSYWTVSYLVRLEDNRLVRRHQYHLRRRTVSSAPEPVETSGVPDDQEEGLEEVHLEFQKEPPPPPPFLLHMKPIFQEMLTPLCLLILLVQL